MSPPVTFVGHHVSQGKVFPGEGADHESRPNPPAQRDACGKFAALLAIFSSDIELGGDYAREFTELVSLS